MTDTAIADAPPTVANVAVGFDVLGFALDAPGDRVRVTRRNAGPAERVTVTVDDDGVIPTDPNANTASVALLALTRDLGITDGFDITIQKGIPLSSGMGGSAASAVGAVVAANALLETSLPREQLLRYALAGEAAASGEPHADNVAPCLYGGLTAAFAFDANHVEPIPLPDGIVCVLARPHVRIDTRGSRRSLATTVPLRSHVEQTARMAAFVTACYRNDLALLGRAMRDVVVEPQRAAAIPGFAAAQRAALDAGAIGCSIAGSGPSIFAWASSDANATAVEHAIATAFEADGTEFDIFAAQIGHAGARIVDEESAA